MVVCGIWPDFQDFKCCKYKKCAASYLIQIQEFNYEDMMLKTQDLRCIWLTLQSSDEHWSLPK